MAAPYRAMRRLAATEEVTLIPRVAAVQTELEGDQTSPNAAGARPLAERTLCCCSGRERWHCRRRRNGWAAVGNARLVDLRDARFRRGHLAIHRDSCRFRRGRSRLSSVRPGGGSSALARARRSNGHRPAFTGLDLRAPRRASPARRGVAHNPRGASGLLDGADVVSRQRCLRCRHGSGRGWRLPWCSTFGERRCSHRGSVERAPPGSRLPHGARRRFDCDRPGCPLASRALGDRVRDSPPACRLSLVRGGASSPAGSCGSKDRVVQCTPRRSCPRRGAGSRSTVRAPGLGDHGRPGPASRGQQHLRPSRWRCCSARGGRRVSSRGSPLRYGQPLRRRGVRSSLARDGLFSGARNRRAHPSWRGRAALRGWWR